MGESARANGGAGWAASWVPGIKFIHSAGGAGRRREPPRRAAAAHAPGALPPRSPRRAAAPPCPHPRGKGAAFRRRPGPWGWGLGRGQRARRRWRRRRRRGAGRAEEGRAVAAARPSRSERGHVHRAPGEGGPRWRGQGGGRDPAAPPCPLAGSWQGCPPRPQSPCRSTPTPRGQVHSGPRLRPLPAAAWGARVGALAPARGGLGVREFSIRFFLGPRSAQGFSH